MPAALPAPAAPGAPNEASSQLNRPSASSGQEVINQDGEADFDADEEMSPAGAAAAGEDEEAGAVLLGPGTGLD